MGAQSIAEDLVQQKYIKILTNVNSNNVNVNSNGNDIKTKAKPSFDLDFVFDIKPKRTCLFQNS
jgi:hypothetical protein